MTLAQRSSNDRLLSTVARRLRGCGGGEQDQCQIGSFAYTRLRALCKPLVKQEVPTNGRLIPAFSAPRRLVCKCCTWALAVLAPSNSDFGSRRDHAESEVARLAVLVFGGPAWTQAVQAGLAPGGGRIGSLTRLLVYLAGTRRLKIVCRAIRFSWCCHE